MLKRGTIGFNKNGSGFPTARISLSVRALRNMNINEENRSVIIEELEDRIIIRKDAFNMLLIKNKSLKINGNMVDYELENGILLYSIDWNGELYGNGFNPDNKENTNCEYKPVYKYQLDNIDISEVEENSEEWYKLTEIVGFEEK